MNSEQTVGETGRPGAEVYHLLTSLNKMHRNNRRADGRLILRVSSQNIIKQQSRRVLLPTLLPNTLPGLDPLSADTKKQLGARWAPGCFTLI